MEENKVTMSAMEIAKKLELLRNKHFGEETIALVKSDYEYGLSEEEISLYLNKSYSIDQMKVISQCLRKGVTEELIDIINDSKLSVHQMQVSVEYFEKGVPIEAIREIVARGEQPKSMQVLYKNILEQLEKAKEKPEESEYVKSLIEKMEEVVKQINHQEERYDALNKKLAEIETSKDDEEVRAHLVEELQSKDAIINNQQDELNKASSTIARLRNENESKKEEMKRMSDRIESLEDKIIKVATDNMKAAERKVVEENRADSNHTTEQTVSDNMGNIIGTDNGVGNERKTSIGSVPSLQDMPHTINGFPVYYQLPIVDGAGNIVQRLPIERTVRKSSNNGMAGLFAKLSFKKKSRADIVKLVASGDLVPAQLVQIKSAIEKGLTESQLVELINNNLSADKMKEIIEIAVLENSIAD